MMEEELARALPLISVQVGKCPMVMITALLMGFMMGPRVPAGSEQKGQVSMETVAYGGWKNNLSIKNDQVELIVTLDVGPRVLSYRKLDGKNVFKEFPDQLGKSGEAEWVVRGGHRLWTAPEDLTRTYAPDNAPVKVIELRNGAVRVQQPPDSAHGVQKEIDIKLDETGSKVTLVHRIRNVGSKPAELAPWALTVMAPGGIEVIPLPPKRDHPGSASNAKTPSDFWPDQSLVLWPYFDFKDPRWTFGSKYITLRQDRRPPTKIGLAHQAGWVAYWNQGDLFVKKFGYQDGKMYPDKGCNFETFSNEDMCEIETLGPKVSLAPGEATELTETWHLVSGVGSCQNEAEIDTNVLPKIPGN